MFRKITIPLICMLLISPFTFYAQKNAKKPKETKTQTEKKDTLSLEKTSPATHLNIYAIDGKMVDRLVLSGTEQKYRISTENLERGVYIGKLMLKDGSSLTFKFQVNR